MIGVFVSKTHCIIIPVVCKIRITYSPLDYLNYFSNIKLYKLGHLIAFEGVYQKIILYDITQLQLFGRL